MNIALWVAQGILGAMFLMLGLMKSTQSKEKLSKIAWTTRSSMQKIRFIGISEFLIGLGLILPQLTGVMPVLTVIAAATLALVMILAIVEHLKYKETKEIATNVVLMVLALFVAWGRYA